MAAVTDEKARAVRQFMRGKSRLLFSSHSLHWSGLLMEQHEFSAGEWPASELSGLILCLWNNTGTVRCDHPDANGNFVPKLVHPGTLSLYTAGILPPARPCDPTRGLICAFDDDFLSELPEEIRSESNTRSVADGIITQDKRCFIDGPVQRTLETLSEEARRGGPSGHRYANHLIDSLRAQLLYLTQAGGRGHWLKNKIDLGTLRRLSDRLDITSETDLDLDTLAAESGYSKRHLMRVYRSTTGRSPHQYIMDLRMEKAPRLMLSSALNLMDIAMECGFSSQAHFAHAFRQRLGVAPSTYRRRLSKTE